MLAPAGLRCLMPWTGSGVQVKSKNSEGFFDSSRQEGPPPQKSTYLVC